MSRTINPAQNATAVTPHDTNDLADISKSLYVGTGGDVKVIMAQLANTVTFTNVPDGSILPIQVTRVFSTDTTASGILNLY